MRPVALYAGLGVLAVALDQWIKQLVEAHLPMREPVDILPFFALYRTYNPGVAFSLFSSAGAVPLILLTLGVVAFVLFLAFRSRSDHVLARIGFTLIVGGAIGNLIDRLLFGHVIDYFLFHTPVWSFAVFNLADAFISVGAAMVLLQELVDWMRHRRPGTADN